VERLLANRPAGKPLTEDLKSRREALLRLREEVLTGMAEAELECARLRIQLERRESDLRLGAAADAEYDRLKGRDLPAAERNLVGLYRQLLKLEAKLQALPSRK